MQKSIILFRNCKVILIYTFRAVFKFDESNRLIVSGTGADVTLFKGQFGPDDKGFGYVKIQVDIIHR